MLQNVLFGLTLSAALLEWTAVEREWKRIRWFSKPGTLILLIAWFTAAGEWRGPLVWFGLGLVCSLLGDIFLMLPQAFFLAGMGAFFAAHVFTIVGFNQGPVQLSWAAAFPFLVVVGAFSALNGRIRAGLENKGQQKMLVPVFAYAVILSCMWLAAFSTLFRPEWPVSAAVLACMGGGLFFFSDSVLAYNRFVHDLPFSDLVVMTTYHLAQLCITSAALITYAA